ncbi:MAG: glycoside hydrolase, partial [Gammaproteobacteria bacterium]
EPLTDPLLSALVAPAAPAIQEQRLALVKTCLRVNREHLILPFPGYRALADIAALIIERPECAVYLSDQYFADIVTWYHLVWLGETVRRTNQKVQLLIDKGCGYTLEERRSLLEIIADLLGSVIPRYRALAECGQVEISFTPYAHPILPLLLDFESAHESLPHAPLPEPRRYPGGEERAHWHIRRGLETFRAHFGFAPQGCWPAEGGVSSDVLRLLSQYGVCWAASGETVLANSLKKNGANMDSAHKDWLYRPYQINGVNCFFRDDGLSDLIGFTYAKWHADDAVNNLISHLQTIAAAQPRPDKIVSIILDGENAWEYYPFNGYYFLTALYQRLSEHPHIKLTTFGDYLEQTGSAPAPLDALTAGSWVYGTFSTWIGSADKNRGWDMLCEAKKAADQALAAGNLTEEQREKIMEQLALCEGSDWFWWFGDYNPGETVSDFERLFRRHLTNLYHLIGKPAPEELAQVLSRGTGAPAHGGVMRAQADA